MDYFLGSVKIMLIVYALAAFISFVVAWFIGLIFTGIKLQKARAMSKALAATEVLAVTEEEA